MKKYIVFLLSFYSTLIFSQKIESYKLTKQEISERELKDVTDFPIYKAFELSDKGGVYELVLAENQKTISKKDTLNTKIQAICVVNDHGGFLEKWRINDLLEDYEPKETNIWFWTKYCSTKDIDGDGYIDPIVVYGTRTEDGYIRRVKIITVYKTKKYVIRAVECDLDDCRSFKKDQNWNMLPQKIKTYVDQLLIKMRKEQDLLLKNG
ncbi:M949_RS01915 family surface polysaccharide biosynthesis protein [Flavobacterium ginsenosidimutans]|uniref:M949_RS01915 family surface polysaccharide biosynthesis protein n=1 Tax=Flavobacterium ginsenosidimutans TaxID=687844 RepID=UPI003D990C96